MPPCVGPVSFRYGEQALQGEVGTDTVVKLSAELSVPPEFGTVAAHLVLRSAMTRTVLLAIGLAAIVSAQAPTVVSTSPAANGFTGPFERIEVQFAAAIDPATVTPFSFAVFGRFTGVVSGALTVDASNTLVTFQPDKPMFVGDGVQVDLANTITSAGGAPLVGGYHFQLVVRSAPGSGVFQLTQQIPFRLPGEGQISTYGIHAGDIDRDGTPDITAINEISHDLRVYKNDGCGSYGPMTLVPDGGNWPSPHDSADFNRDGWLDLTTGDYLFGNLSVFLNDGTGDYLPPFNLPGGSFLRSVGTGDFNGDGYPDIAAGNGTSTLIWLNDGAGGFLPSVGYTNGQLEPSAELNVVDANEDGYLDIIMASVVGANMWVLLGNGDGTFTATALSVPLGGNPWASAAWDINGDGHIDACYVTLSPQTFRWTYGDGLGGFVAGGSLPTGNWPTSVHLADLEGDGDIDAVISTFNSSDFRIHFNDGTGNFGTPVIFPALGGGSCTTLVDYDRDGDIDIIGADEIWDQGMIFTQTGPVVAGIQQPSCTSSLRVDQRGAGDGFGGRPAVPVRVGGQAALSMSGASGSYGAIGLGFAAATAVPILQWGLWSFDPTMPVILVAFAPLDQHGEMLATYAVPASVPPGISLMAQGLMFAPGAELFTNPVRFVLVP